MFSNPFLFTLLENGFYFINVHSNFVIYFFPSTFFKVWFTFWLLEIRLLIFPALFFSNISIQKDSVCMIIVLQKVIWNIFIIIQNTICTFIFISYLINEYYLISKTWRVLRVFLTTVLISSLIRLWSENTAYIVSILWHLLFYGLKMRSVLINVPCTPAHSVHFLCMVFYIRQSGHICG